MGHYLILDLISKSELRNEKLDSILNDKEISELKYIELGAGILALWEYPDTEEFRKDKTIAHIKTDYFGGMGYQEAKLWVNGELVYDKSDEFDHKCNPIDEVLRIMGVNCNNGMDEFDTVGLGKYRCYDDVEEKINSLYG